MSYDPKCEKFPYPEITDQHYLKVERKVDTVFDKNYPYIDTSKKFQRKRKLVALLLRTIVFPMTRIRLNLKIKGRENLKTYKELLSHGYITVCNHVHMWDYLAILVALKRTDIHFLSWAENLRGPSRNLVKLVGGIPIPEDTGPVFLSWYRLISKYLQEDGILHIFSEGSMWEFYKYIRPFKEGASHFAMKNNKPILPLAFSYRKNGWIRTKIFHSPASLTLTIGSPILPNQDLSLAEGKEDLTIKTHDEICKLAGILPSKNLYPPIFENNKRVDYYTKEYGKGYKGSF